MWATRAKNNTKNATFDDNLRTRIWFEPEAAIFKARMDLHRRYNYWKFSYPKEVPLIIGITAPTIMLKKDKLKTELYGYKSVHIPLYNAK